MRILVTGGSGYVGSHAVRALIEAGHEVLIYDNFSTGHAFLSKGLPVVVGDIGDKETLLTHLKDKDAVMHFAASAYVGESVVNPRKYFRNNVESALTMLDAVLESDVRQFIFSSTCATYGIPPELPISESSPMKPINPYGETKLFFERVLAAYAVSHGLRSVSLRYFNAAGAHADGSIGEYHEPEPHLIPLALRAMLGTGPALKVFGNNLPTPDGTCVRDYIHVQDLASAHVGALAYLAAGGQTVSMNLGTGKGVSIADLISMIEQVSGRPVPHSFAEPRPGDPPALYSSPVLAETLLGWKAERDLRTIIESALAWEEKLPKLLATHSK